MSRILSALLVLGLVPLTVSPAVADDLDRNCPIAEDQFVIVQPGTPTAFRLRVLNLGAGEISIFQYPQGGILEQPGPTPLDFIFVPTADFSGTTTFTYRLQTPIGCGSRSELGLVTIAGGASTTGTASGLPVPEETGICGFGPLSLVSAIFACFVMKHPLRRRKSR